MKRIFYKADSGEILAVQYPSKKYLGGTFVPDESRPICAEVDDKTKPIMIDVDDISKPLFSEEDDLTRPIIELVDDDEKPIFDQNGRLAAYDKKKVVTGYHKKIVGYEKKKEFSGAYEKKMAFIGYEKRELTIDDCKIPEQFKKCLIKLIDTDEEFPAHEYTNQMVLKDGEITVDSSKSETLLPVKFVKNKHIAYLESVIDGELSKDSPDVVGVLRAFREREICKNKKIDDELFWTQKALDGLERAEIAKPVIKKKLKEKISTLKGK